ncbi:hypothetical protein BkAM31D_14140 [Halalkalibacter krulwichiae]|uniref:Uncharacterized protein n=1 Tax=Halalkalibacter krulwichiae TaxID=199441 RepID=A0A1X9MBT8_9BACI|nr:hypothetical protein BkAM31D_14140 [Halalkalibacter krulwichiae]
MTRFNLLKPLLTAGVIGSAIAAIIILILEAI